MEIQKDHEARYFEIITDIYSWCEGPVMYAPEFYTENNPLRIIEIKDNVVQSQILNFLKDNNLLDYEIQKYETFYTKECKNYDGLAGKFWLGLKIWLRSKK